MEPVESICVVYDQACGLCTGVKAWIKRQVPLVRVEFTASGSADAQRRFPGLPAGELAVISGTGDVWLGNSAWIVCLWALRDYRSWALRLCSPLLLTMAREAFAVISQHHGELSGMLGMRSDVELEQQLRTVVVPRCQADGPA